jgi:nucleoside-diphosphate-sugar epimerase
MTGGSEMNTKYTVLLVGGTGRTGRRVLEQLLSCDIGVRAIVRSADRLPKGAAQDPRLELVEADLLSLSDEDLLRNVRGCDAVISCLGHVLSLKGIFGPPRDLVTQATRRLCRAIVAAQPTTPVKFILMSSVSVNQPAGRDTHRGAFEKAVVWMLRGVLPPVRDNQEAADFLCDSVGPSSTFVQWAVVRPDTLLEGDVSEYTLHENLVSSLFRPDSTNMANVAHFMCDMVRSDVAWDRWSARLPVIVNANAPNS